MAKKAQLSLVRDIDQIAERWVKLRREIERRELELKALTPPLKEVLKKSPNREREFGPYVLFLTKDSDRTNFDREEATKVLGQKTLEPFLSKTPVEGYIKLK